MALANIKKDATLADKAYSAIKLAIIKNELAPGEMLTEESLAEQLGISRTPLRAALQRLLYEEIVVQHGKNIVVSDVTSQNVLDVNIVRMQLEPLAIRLIGTNGGLLPDQLAQLQACNEKQQAAVAAGDGIAFLDQDYLFHVTLARFSGNTYLADIMEKCTLTIMRYHVLSGNIHRFSQSAGQEHTMILQALSVGDYAAAEVAIRTHFENVDSRFTQVNS